MRIPIKAGHGFRREAGNSARIIFIMGRHPANRIACVHRADDRGCKGGSVGRCAEADRQEIAIGGIGITLPVVHRDERQIAPASKEALCRRRFALTIGIIGARRRRGYDFKIQRPVLPLATASIV